MVIEYSSLGENIEIKGFRPIISNANTSITLALTDADSYIRTTNAAAVTITIPPNSTVAFNLGTEMDFIQAAVGQISFVAGAGVTINSASGNLKVGNQYGGTSLKKIGIDEWDLVGDLTA